MKKPLATFACLLALTFAAAAEEANIRLNLPNAPIADVLRYYGQLTGQQVICDHSVQGQIDLVSNGLVSTGQAVEMIESALFLNGFSLVDAPGGGIVKVLGLGKPVRSEGVPIYASVEALPKNERVASLIINLQYIAAREMAGLLSQYAPPSASCGAVASRSGALVVTGQTSLLRSLAKVVAAFDVPQAESTPREPAQPAAQPTPRPQPPVLPGKPIPPKAGDDDD